MNINWHALLTVIYILTVVYVLSRVMLRAHREPASRVAWMVVVSTLPVVGIVLYFLFGETSIGNKRSQRMKEIQHQLFASTRIDQSFVSELSSSNHYQHIFNIGRSINGFPPVAGNQVELLNNSETSISSMIADIDAAQQEVNILFYIWLTDHSGRLMVEALIRAATRGVNCRILVDAVGSRSMLSSKYWSDMQQAGVHVASSLPVGNPFLRILFGRIDLRNHRKIVVIDQTVTYCGSQNCADAAFSVKAKFAPWVDIMLRITGPVVQQNLQLFASDWQAATHVVIVEKPQAPAAHQHCPAQVIGTGPTIRNAAMSDVFLTLITSAWQDLVITTPYFVPNEALQSALCSVARRGVNVVLVVPKRNDSWVVSGASRSYYLALLQSGVVIYEYVAGLLHSKSITIDGQITLIGSANMDRRSFDLNYENNMVFHDKTLTAQVVQRQHDYIQSSEQVSIKQVQAWSKSKQLWHNTLAILGPVL